MGKDCWNPDQYEKFKIERRQPFRDLMDLLEPLRAGGQTELIDLGCGTGELTAELHRYMQASKSTGLDSSQAMLEKAEKFAGGGLRFQKGEIEKFTESAQYDVIFSNAALQWCGDHPALFRRLKESLKDGGQLAVQMPMNSDYVTHMIAYDLGREQPWAGLLRAPYEKPMNLLSPEGYANLLFDLGFQKQKVFLRVYDHVLETREGVLEWVRGSLLTHFQSHLEPRDYVSFETEFTRRLMAKLPDRNPFFYPFKRVLIWGRI